MNQSDIERFERMCMPEPNSGCWIWMGYVSNRPKKPYGTFKVSGHTTASHRFSYKAYKGDVPEGLFVLHRCDNPSCVNPDHLWLGTNDDNVQDMISKGRQARGVKHGMAKLTGEDVKVIFQSNKSTIESSREYGVDPEQIRRIRKKLRWSHVTEGLELGVSS